MKLNKPIIQSFILLISTLNLYGLKGLQLPDAKLKDISKNMSVNIAHKSAFGAQPLSGALIPFGFNIGILGGMTSATLLDKSLESDFKNLPNLNLIAMAGIPFGINVELNYFPEINVSDITYKNYSVAIKCTISKFFPIPVPFLHLAIRFYMGDNNINLKHKYDGASENIEGSFKFQNTTKGIDFIVSTTALPFIEPFLGLGYLGNDTKISVSATNKVRIFPDITAATSVEKTISSSQLRILLGVGVNLALFGAGAELNFVGDQLSYAFRISLGL
jgi:hypothetical protein